MEDLGKTLRLGDIENLVMLDCGLYGQKCSEWTANHFRQQSWNKGDIISMDCRYLVENDIDPKIAKRILEEIYLLLLFPVRWPYELNRWNDAKTRREYKKSQREFDRDCKRYKKLGVSTATLYRKYRTRTGMTRDPYVYFFAACVKYSELNYIKWTKIPVISEGDLLFRFNLWLWRRSLITSKRSWLYELIERKPNHKKDYVNLLRWYRMKAYKTRMK
jgi:hypothetical protein